jgi:adenylate kinase family enzyme
MMHKEEMMEAKMEHMMEWFKALPEDKKKAVIKARLEMYMKKMQAKMDFLKEMQKIFG